MTSNQKEKFIKGMTQTYTIKSRHPKGYIETRNDVPEGRVFDFIEIAERNLYKILSIEKNEGDNDVR